jgi:hypothetical protein
MLDPKNRLAPVTRPEWPRRIIESVDVKPAPLRMVLGSQALEGALTTLRKRIADFEAQTELASSTDFLPGKYQRPHRKLEYSRAVADFKAQINSERGLWSSLALDQPPAA